MTVVHWIAAFFVTYLALIIIAMPFGMIGSPEVAAMLVLSAVAASAWVWRRSKREHRNA